MLRSLAWLILAATTALNAYIHLFPIWHQCKWTPGASVRLLAFGDPQITGTAFPTIRKRLDVAGNDEFLAHTVRTARRWLKPRFVAVMGDLISSQWVDTDEFDARADRYSNIFDPNGPGLLINVSGNHDVGYHGEFTDERLSRFRRRYGALNYVQNFDSEGWRFVVINSLALDGPPWDQEHHDTMAFIETLGGYAGSTILLLHVPLYKPAGICRDHPAFDYYDEPYGGGLRNQNHLSKNTTHHLLHKVLEGGGIVVTGHDHEGCEASYNKDLEVQAGFGLPIKEATVRSVMGEYGGNSGIISGSLTKTGWVWDYQLCRFSIQHVWWATQVLDYLSILALQIVLF